MIGREVRYFAFPYGMHKNLSVEAFDVAFNAGYYGVCSAYGGYNFPGDDAFHLRRIHADPELVRLKNWLTVDPRKVRSQIDFDPARGSGDLGRNSYKGVKTHKSDSPPILSIVTD